MSQLKKADPKTDFIKKNNSGAVGFRTGGLRVKKHKMRCLNRIIALLAVLIITSASAFSVCAADYTAVNGGTTSFDVYLVVDKDTSIPAAEFSYTVNAGDAAQATDESLFAVEEGIMPEKVVLRDANNNVGRAVFTAGQATTAVAVDDGITDSDDKQYASDKVTVDFTAVSFSEPGVYRYVIIEALETKDRRITEDPVKERTIDVYVIDNEGTLEVADYIMYSGKIDGAPKREATDASAVKPNPNGAEPDGAKKTDRYINTYGSCDLTFEKKVTGNQGSKDKYFKFTISLSNAVPGSYTVDLSNAVAAPVPTDATKVDIPAGTQQVTEIVVGDDGKAAADFYLQHGQSITVKELAKGTVYTVQEKKEEYTAAAKVNDVVSKATLGDGTTASDLATFTEDAATKTATVTSKDGGIDVDTTVEFTNNKVGVIPTGILLSATPWIIAGVIVIAGIIFFAVRSRKKYDEE